MSGAPGVLRPRWEADAVLPYEDPRSAVAGLRAELRHLVAADPGSVAPDWRTFAVSGPQRCVDVRGRTWFAYRATLRDLAAGSAERPASG